MKVIQYARTASIVQIEVPEFKPTPKVKKGDKPPAKVKNQRAKSGALHVRPGTTATVTDDELAILKDHKVPFRLIGDHKPKPKPEKAPQAPQEAPQGGAPADRGEGGGEGDAAPGAADKPPKGRRGGK